jgi:hypothetical protein
MNAYNITFDSISTFTDIQNFLLGPIRNLYFVDSANPENPYTKQYVSVGTLKVRFLRTLEVPCKQTRFDIQNSQCFYSQYTDSTRQTFATGLEEFKTARQNGIDEIVREN